LHKAFPEEARRTPRFSLDFVQRGLRAGRLEADEKPSAPASTRFRMRDASGAYRVIYLATRPEAVYVLHCFQKKTEKTSQHDIDLAQKRFQSHTETCEK